MIKNDDNRVEQTTNKRTTAMNTWIAGYTGVPVTAADGQSSLSDLRFSSACNESAFTSIRFITNLL